MEAWSELGDILGIMPHESSPLETWEDLNSEHNAYNTRIIPMKKALDAALQVEIAQEPKP